MIVLSVHRSRVVLLVNISSNRLNGPLSGIFQKFSKNRRPGRVFWTGGIRPPQYSTAICTGANEANEGICVTVNPTHSPHPTPPMGKRLSSERLRATHGLPRGARTVMSARVTAWEPADLAVRGPGRTLEFKLQLALAVLHVEQAKAGTQTVRLHSSRSLSLVTSATVGS